MNESYEQNFIKIPGAVNNQASPLAACARNATENASFAIHSSDPQLWCASATVSQVHLWKINAKNERSECNYGALAGRCTICGGVGISDAYYCKECTIQEKDRDGCPKIINLGSARTDLFYERKKFGATGGGGGFVRGAG